MGSCVRQFFLCLEPIAPSRATHAHAARLFAGEMASEIPEIFYSFDPQLISCMLKINSFSITQKNTSWIYLVKVFLLLLPITTEN